MFLRLVLDNIVEFHIENLLKLFAFLLHFMIVTIQIPLNLKDARIIV